MSTVLARLGVDEHTLNADEKRTLDEDGYLRLENLMAPEEVKAFVRRLDELAELEGEDAGKEVHQEEGTIRLSNLIDKDPIFEKCLTSPRLLAAIRHVLGDEFKSSSLNSRAALPGNGRQGLHADWGGAVAPGDYFVCNSIWLLSDFTRENGATRVLPGSHRCGHTAADEMSDTIADHPDQVQLFGEAGAVVVFNSHLWHGGMTNETDSPRRAMHSYFCRRDQRQQLDQRKWLREETLSRLSLESKVILDVADVDERSENIESL
ncbi:MAG: phytanoyl-CoA dioxygenase family protein [Candidatus Poribacteria bacterium]|nr:phytanoyl-CoA dioxygenase family protein [Candidatus Poribacteria bacterium]MDE0505072.1 phytanoyl-CoA dioxygenase family protein [Candidatus Poribacteria bacterium]